MAPLIMIWAFQMHQARLAAEDDPVPMADLAVTIGEILQDDYYDHSRIRPAAMVERALQAMESAEISLNVDRWGDQMQLQMGETVVSWQVTPATDLASACRLLDEIRRRLAEGPYDATRRREISYALINGALQVLDPHTVLIPPEPADRFSEEIDGEFFGIGAYLNERDGIVRIERVMSGLPADRYGVRDGDVILAVDGEKTMGLSLPQTVRRIKGPRNTTVVLTVEREGHDEPIDLAIVRELVQYVTMGSKRVGDIGYLQMNQFNKLTYRDLVDHIIKLQRIDGEQQPLRGFVLDLRYNGGGLLRQAQIITDLFLPPAREIVRTVMPGREPHTINSNRRMLIDLPLVVLTSPGSASASEIVSGALQLNERAVVIGTTTFGKGSVQTIRGIADGSQLKFTIQEYQLRQGASIQGHGVVPDIALLRRSQDQAGAIDLVPYSPRRESSNEFALLDQGTYSEQSSFTLGWLREFVSEEDQRQLYSIASPSFGPDPEADLVIDLLSDVLTEPDIDAKGRQALAEGQARSFLLERLVAQAERRAEVESLDLALAITEHHTDLTWGNQERPQVEELELSFIGPNEVAAGQEIELSFSLRNLGADMVGKLYGIVRGHDASPLWESEVIFGQIAPGEANVGKLSFAVPPRMVSRPDQLTLELFYNADTEPLLSHDFELSYQSLPRPHFNYRWTMIEGPDADGQLSMDESVQIEMTIHNDGDGESFESVLYLLKDNDQHVQLGEGRVRLPPIAAGDSTTVRVPVSVRSSITSGRRELPFAGDAIQLQVRIEERMEPEVDNRFRASLFTSIDIPLNQAVIGTSLQKPQVSVNTATVTADRSRLSLLVTVVDDNPHYISVFRGRDKVWLFTDDDLDDQGQLRCEVPLNEGLNEISVMAHDHDEITTVSWLYHYLSATQTAPVPDTATAATSTVVPDSQVGEP